MERVPLLMEGRLETVSAETTYSADAPDRLTTSPQRTISDRSIDDDAHGTLLLVTDDDNHRPGEGGAGHKG